MILLIDVGNTRVKWGFDIDGQLQEQDSVFRDDGLFDDLVSLWQQAQIPKRVVVACVTRDATTDLIQQAAQRLWCLDIEYLQVEPGRFGIELAYAKPELLGIDRWLAMIAARERVSGVLMVVASGTALTIDILNTEGKHLGGVVAPGLALMQRSLTDCAAGIQRGLVSEQVQASGWLGRDTRQGIEQGGLYALAGAVEHVYYRTLKEMGGAPSVIIGGGDALSLSVELGVEAVVVSDLVLRGMQLVIGES